MLVWLELCEDLGASFQSFRRGAAKILFFSWFLELGFVRISGDYWCNFVSDC